MVHKIARKCRHVARVAVHEAWISLQVSGVTMWPMVNGPTNLAETLQAIRQRDLAWHAAYAHAEDMRDMKRWLAGKDE